LHTIKNNQPSIGMIQGVLYTGSVCCYYC